MQLFGAEVRIENRPPADDPEGEAIHRKLILNGGLSKIVAVRVGKMFRVRISASSEDEARRIVLEMCDDLRVFHPATQVCRVKVTAAGPH